MCMLLTVQWYLYEIEIVQKHMKIKSNMFTFLTYCTSQPEIQKNANAKSTYMQVNEILFWNVTYNF